jgi:hypothetical protein
LKAEITEGLLWVWRQPFLRAAVGVIGGVNLVFNASPWYSSCAPRNWAPPRHSTSVVNNHLYQVTPDRLLGRVRSAARLVAWGSIPLGTLAGGFVASAFGAPATLLILTAIMCAVAAAATLARGMRQLPPPLRAREHPGTGSAR